MAGAISHARLNPALNLRTVHGARCCSRESDDKAPKFIRFAVSGVTELLRLFSLTSSSSKDRLNQVCDRQTDEFAISSVDDVAMVLESDYEKTYFVTGNFTSKLYADDCIFEDPTIRFQGTELYERNLKLLVPFLDRPSIGLQKIEKGVNSEVKFIEATWMLRTYLKLPWRPLISVNGTTVYELNNCFKIVRHLESWDVSALEAIAQIFTPTSGQPHDQM